MNRDIVFDASVVAKGPERITVPVPTIDDMDATIPGEPISLTFRRSSEPWDFEVGDEVTIAIMFPDERIPDTPFNRRVTDAILVGMGGIILGIIAWVYGKVVRE